MEKLRIKRAPDEKRRRPDAIRRNDMQHGGLLLDESINDVFIHNTNLEWLSLNWRKYRASKISTSIRRLILYMFEEMFEMKLGFFPTLREIRDGLIGGQICELEAKQLQWCDITMYESIK